MDREFDYAAARGAFRHQGVARRLVADFKFGGQPVLGRIMAGLAQPAFSGFLSSIGPSDRLLVTWVPCHPSARRERGYNQSEILARELTRACPPDGRPAGPLPLVRKTLATRHQKGLGRAGRRGNLRDAFTLEPAACIQAATKIDGIVLVDDVYTTGATAGEVSRVLSRGAGLPVYVFTFSRTIASVSERHD